MGDLVKSDNIYALYAIPPDDFSTVHAISLNREILQDILENQVLEEYKQMVQFEIKPIQVFLCGKLINPDKNTTQIFGGFGTNKDLILMPTTMLNPNTFTNKMFGFNTQIKNGDYIQSILLIAHDSAYDSDVYQEHINYIKEQTIFKNNLSREPIQFDTYYDESIMNI